MDVWARRILLLSFLSPVFANALPRYLYETPKFCEYFLSTEGARLSDLIGIELVEPDGGYLYSPRQDISEHELKTAKLLAERLRRPVALLPRLTRSINVPAVDGILFDEDGNPARNFSLKTFIPSAGSTVDLNQKLLATMRVAQHKIETNYAMNRWKEIIIRGLPRSATPENSDSECLTYAKIFGISDQQVRPVTIVIDYTLDPTAVFRLHMQKHPRAAPDVHLTLNSEDRGINILALMRRIHTHPTIEEYVFLGPHHLLSVTEIGFHMTEFCDTFGHSH